ncbi:MAG: DivIVA domain-containing protein, partial [Acidimicrobiia bacterium]|nr:DivIVA domain-containing protein [Acidimicrobiia bacterium]
MDLTPQVINEIEFSMARRGYDPDQVDEFLEKVAVAVADLNTGLAEARERVAAAERRAEEAEVKASQRPERVVEVPAEQSASAAAVAAEAEAELETLKRTLVLAQRTADAAVKEAEVEARRIVGAAEADARAAHEDTRRRLVDELSTLEVSRDSLRDDVRAIERHLDEQRLRLRGSIAELQRILEDPSRLKAATPPAAVTDPVPVPKP